jgi:hypothetical protein
VRQKDVDEMHNQTFDFESDFVDSLRCVPMAVRLKLDTIGVKLTLRQWSGLSRAERQDLLDTACQTGRQAAAYRRLLRRMLEDNDLGPMRDLHPDLAVRPLDGPAPEQVARFARRVGVGGIAEHQWARLDPLQRFALVKLSRNSHDNVNFVPALREFGVL